MMTSNEDLSLLADEITTLCGHPDAAEFRLLELIRRFDEVAPWGLWEVKSCAHWLNWKCGIGLGAAREKVRVAHALPGLPMVSEAFREGRLSYSKVRAITRIATAENEEHLVEMALAATAAHIERIVRKYRQVERLHTADQAMALYESRSLSYYWAEDGALVLQGRLTPEQGAVLIEALQRADKWIETSDESREARRADALSLIAEKSLSGVATEADRFHITVHVSAETLRHGTVDPEDPPTIEDGSVLAPDTVRRLACDAGVIPILETGEGELLSIGRRTRTIAPALRRALKRRDAGCRFPGCTHTRFVDGHHIRHWADGGETSLENLVLLCRHHHRLIHEGGFAVERIGNSFQFTDPRGNEVLASAEKRSRGNVYSLFDANVDLDINADTTVPAWYGDRPDYDHILWVMATPVHLTESPTR
jgi:hypothetical protein